MTQEEKAKAYDEALERAKKYNIDDSFASQGAVVKLIFPELRESEDERIIKALETFINQPEIADKITFEARIGWLNWLEKQKEAGIQWFKSDNVKNPDKPYIDKAGMFYTTDGRMCYASEIEKQKEQKSAEWSKEDEIRLKEAIEALNESVKDYLNSLKLLTLYDHLKESM